MSNGKLVFIGVPMNGKTDKEIREAIDRCKKFYLDFKKEDANEVLFVDNYDYGLVSESLLDGSKHPAVRYLSRAIFRLASCDEAVFSVGPGVARGCTIEQRICSAYSIPYMCMKEKE